MVLDRAPRLASGDRSHIQMLQLKGFNNTHIYHPYEVLPYPLWK